MIRVKNKKIIRTLSARSLKAGRARNIIAVAAIALTTIMFTALFTIGATILNSYEQSAFLQAGGDMHGTFKEVTEEQIKELISDPLVVEYGVRQNLGMPSDPPFDKMHVEISYMDAVSAQGYFCKPQQGSMPEEGTREIACDTRILEQLGVKPEIGAEVTLSYYMGMGGEGKKELITDTFLLSGWWESGATAPASQAIVPRSYADKVLAAYERQSPLDTAGQWTLNIYLKSSSHIEENMNTILDNAGFQSQDKTADNYIDLGVNWAYVGAQINAKADLGTVIAIGVLLILITFTGYLIIYNIFQISVANDIRFYGLLKTIGTTGKQIKVMVRRQALILSAAGIPLGLLAGYFCGNVMTPVIMSMMSFQDVYMTANPFIFVGASAFSLVTVLISCRKPGKVAGRVSPVEAVRYTENSEVNQSYRKGHSKSGVFHMAAANLSRSKKRTVLVLISLSLAVVLLQVTFTFTRGFDLDKYLKSVSASDFIVADAEYFKADSLFSSETALPGAVADMMDSREEIGKSGRIYGTTGFAREFVTEDLFRQKFSWYTEEMMQKALSQSARDAEGKVETSADLYGMEEFALDQLKVAEGDLSALYDPSQKSIAAVYKSDDYGNVERDSNWAKLGDTVTIRYIDEWEYTDGDTGAVVEDPESYQGEYVATPVKYHDVTYTVAACVTMSHSMSYRHYGDDQFVLNGDVFKQDSPVDEILMYMADATDPSAAAEMESFLADYTENRNPSLSYESRKSYEDDFNQFRNIFLVMGSALCGIVGFVGILNFFNAIMTSIMTRRREFAMLQSIGMTDRQLRHMLIWEGIGYAGFTAVISLILSLAAGPILGKVMGDIFWFFTYRFTIAPVLAVTPVFLVLGIIIPLIVYRFVSRQTIVERLRENQ